MNRLKSLVTLCALVLALAGIGVAQTQVNQLPTYCIKGAQVQLIPSGGAYMSQAPGIYNCVATNVWALFAQNGANVQAILAADVTNTTATAATYLSYPILALTNYSFSCTVLYTNSSTNAEVFTLTTPASPTNVLAFAQVYTTNTGTSTDGLLSGSPLAFTAAAAGAGSTVYRATIVGTIENGATAGTLAFQISAASGTSTVKRGSFCTLF